jgi:hypothetical protein
MPVGTGRKIKKSFITSNDEKKINAPILIAMQRWVYLLKTRKDNYILLITEATKHFFVHRMEVCREEMGCDHDQW